jgi:hypothetical protein
MRSAPFAAEALGSGLIEGPRSRRINPAVSAIRGPGPRRVRIEADKNRRARAKKKRPGLKNETRHVPVMT